jgi:hypothetical protein
VIDPLDPDEFLRKARAETAARVIAVIAHTRNSVSVKWKRPVPAEPDVSGVSGGVTPYDVYGSDGKHQGFRPWCWNRPAPPPGQWMKAGHRGLKPVLRWVRYPFDDRCAAWDRHPGGQEPDPVRLNWNCNHCRWRPQT